MGISISNQEFLKAVFSNPPSSHCAWTTSFQANPSEATFEWGGRITPVQACRNYVDSNAYFSVALFAQDAPKRRKETMKEMHVVVLDDVQSISISPSWRLETSENNYQVGFILSDPITDAQLGTRLLQEVGRKSYVNSNDQNGNNPVRYVRLPVAVNTKTEPPFAHRLVEFSPDRRYSLDTLIQALQLDAQYIYKGAPSTRASSTLVDDFSRIGPVDLKEMKRQIVEDGRYHDQMLKIVAKLISEGMSPADVRAHCEQFMLAIPPEQRRSNWPNDYADIGHMVKGAVEKGFANRQRLGHQIDLQTGEINETNEGQMYGDIYNGKVFSELFSGQMLYCHASKEWLRWNGQVWQWCLSGEQDVLAKQASNELIRRAAQAFASNPKGEENKLIQANAKQTLNNQKRADMLRAASTEPGMWIGSMAELDADPMLLGCSNGVISLTTGTLLSSDPKMLITKQVRATYDSEAKAPLWERFISECFLGDAETIRYIQKALGYSLTGDVGEEVMHFFYGIGSNGKTLLTNVIYNILSDYAAIADTDLLMRKDKTNDNTPTPDIARLQGKRFVIANEVEEGRRLNDKNLKTLASKQNMHARELYGKTFEFAPQHKIFVTTNHKPYVSDQSEGAWRRIRMVPFLNRVSGNQIDYGLENKLMSEASGILNWLIRGCLMWQKERLNPSLAIERSSSEYRRESDVFGLFISECCKEGPEEKVDQQSLFHSWRKWCIENGHQVGSKRTLTIRLETRGFSSKAYIGKTRAYQGISLDLSAEFPQLAAA
jgi:P4 family phage/plasmid primase-like protien